MGVIFHGIKRRGLVYIIRNEKDRQKKERRKRITREKNLDWVDRATGFHHFLIFFQRRLKFPILNGAPAAGEGAPARNGTSPIAGHLRRTVWVIRALSCLQGTPNWRYPRWSATDSKANPIFLLLRSTGNYQMRSMMCS